MFGDNLKKVRKRNGFTQEQLGSAVGVTGAYIQQLEKGIKKNPSMEVVLKLCDVLHVLPWEISEGDTEISKALSEYISLNINLRNGLENLQNQTKSTLKIAGKTATLAIEKINNNAVTGLKYLAKYASVEDELSVLSNEDEVYSLLDDLSTFLEFELYKIKKNKSENDL